MLFLLLGAWPVLGFFGLDVALVYIAFKLNYRSGRLYETVELTPAKLMLDAGAPLRPTRAVRLQSLLGARQPARMAGRAHGPQARSAQGKELVFGRFLTDDERRDFATALTGALVDARGGARI